MATLEKIRSKSVLLFTIIIVALLAFILGDFFNSGRSLFGPGDTVAKAAGAKVKFNDYQERAKKYSDMTKGQGVNPDEINQAAIRSLLLESLLDKEYDRMGITVTDKELSAFMTGPQTGQIVLQMIAQEMNIQPQAFLQMGFDSSSKILDAIKNPKKYGLSPDDANIFETAWVAVESKVDSQIRQQAYLNLLVGLFTANNIDAKTTYNDRNTTTTFNYVAQDYTTIPDDQVKLTDADYTILYNAHKGAFRLNQEKRYISYITVSMVPSETDRKNAETATQQLAQALQNDTTANPMATVRKFHGFSSKTAKFTRPMMAQDQDLRVLSFTIDSMAKGAVRQLPVLGTDYTVAKLLDITTGIDTVKFTAMPVADVNKLDSVLATVTLANIDSLAGPQSANQTMSLITNQFQLTEPMLKQFAQAPLNTITVITDSIQGPQGKQAVALIANVKHRSQAVPVYEVGYATYELTPSDATIKDLTQALTSFVGNNSTAAAFNKNAGKAGYQVMKALVSASDPIGNSAPGSMSAVKWAIDADKGQVSKVYSLTRPVAQNGSNQYLLAVALEETYDDDYIPATSQFVKNMLKDRVMADKKSKLAANKVKGTTLAEVAAALNTQPATASSMFADSNIAGIMGASPELIAAVAAAKPGTLVGPIKGNGQNYYIQVVESKTAGRPYNSAENRNNFYQRMAMPLVEQTPEGAILPSLQLLLGTEELTNNLLEFTPAE